MALAQGAVGGVVHDQEGGGVFNVKVENAHDVGVDKGGDGFGFALEVISGFVGELGMQDFDGRLLGGEAQVLAEVNFGEASTSEEADEAVVAELLAGAVGHGGLSSPLLPMGEGAGWFY